MSLSVQVKEFHFCYDSAMLFNYFYSVISSALQSTIVPTEGDVTKMDMAQNKEGRRKPNSGEGRCGILQSKGVGRKTEIDGPCSTLVLDKVCNFCKILKLSDALFVAKILVDVL